MQKAFTSHSHPSHSSAYLYKSQRPTPNTPPSQIPLPRPKATHAPPTQGIKEPCTHQRLYVTKAQHSKHVQPAAHNPTPSTFIQPQNHINAGCISVLSPYECSGAAPKTSSLLYETVKSSHAYQAALTTRRAVENWESQPHAAAVCRSCLRTCIAGRDIRGQAWVARHTSKQSGQTTMHTLSSQP
jgi:hypothetical protein